VVLRRIFGPKRDEVTEAWRKLHNEVIKLRRKRWAGHVARTGEGRGVYKILVGKLVAKRTCARPRRR